MKRLNFMELRVPLGIRGVEYQTVDAREAIADLLYTHANGIAAHSLALKIYNSGGTEEYSDSEAEMIRAVVERYCLPSVIDAVREVANNETTKQPNN